MASQTGRAARHEIRPVEVAPPDSDLAPAARLKSPEALPWGLRVLEDEPAAITVAAYAGERYRWQGEAARVRLRLDPAGDPAAARLIEAGEAPFALGSGSRRAALRQAEALAARRGVRVIEGDFPPAEFARMPHAARRGLIRDLQAEGYALRAEVRAPGGRRALVTLLARESVEWSPEPEPLALTASKRLAGDRTAPAETDHARLAARFAARGELRAAYEAALDRLARTDAGERFTRALPAGTTLRGLVERDRRDFGVGRDLLTHAAGLAADAGLEPKEAGTLVHRLAELRALRAKPQEVLAGARLAEQRIDFVEDGQPRHVEIDAVIVRGDKHYLRDYKPVNLADFERTEGGRQWAAWMEQNAGPDFRRQIQLGRIPCERGQPREIRLALRDFLRQANDEHRAQLERYAGVYAAARGIEPRRVHAHVRPYFVYR